MIFQKHPEWIDPYNYSYSTLNDVPASVFEEINRKLDEKQSDNPLISIVCIARNEEINILKTLATLADTKTEYPFEIIVINNHSTDRTQETLDRLHVKSFFQPIEGWGPARQMGLEKAKGKYLLQADADCFYPKDWVDQLVRALDKPGVSCVYGKHSFLEEVGFERWKLFLFEGISDIVAFIRHFNRPYLNVYGQSMGYLREHALKIGFTMEKVRGEDGRLALGLMQFGKIEQVRSEEACIWTSPRALRREGSFGQVFWVRIRKELVRFYTLLPFYKIKK